MVKGTPTFNTLTPFIVMTPAPTMIIPPVPLNVAGHSAPVVNRAGLLYWIVEDAPIDCVVVYVTVAVPAIERIPLIVLALVKVFAPLPERVRLLNVVAVAEIVWAAPPKFTVPVPALKTVPVPFQAVVLVAFSLSILEPPFNVPAVRVTIPVKVWVPVPRLSVPPVPLMVSAAPLTLPVNVAVPPAVLVMETVPVVVKLPILCVAVPASVTPPVVPLTVPLLLRSPFKVNKKVDIVKVAPLLIVSVPYWVTVAPRITEFPVVVAMTTSSFPFGATPPIHVPVKAHVPPVSVLVIGLTAATVIKPVVLAK